MKNTQALDHLHATINRLADNSRNAKAWTVTLVTAVLATAAALNDPWVTFSAVYVCAAFGGLDAYYLALERLFRAEYRKHSSLSRESECEWPPPAPVTKTMWLSALRSTSVWPFYLVPIGLISISFALAL